jgi:hypothetical protein
MKAAEIAELVRQGVQSYNARDAEASLAIWDPDSERHPFLPRALSRAECSDNAKAEARGLLSETS